MKTPQTVKELEELGRFRLSKSFFMREFLYSEISQIENLSNIPENPELAIASGRNLCQKVLEPIQQQLGKISIRSAYRSREVNAKGTENNNQYNCAANESNYAKHIWKEGMSNFTGFHAEFYQEFIQGLLDEWGKAFHY